MIALSDKQLQTVMAAASHVPHEKPSRFLERVAAMLTLRGRGHFNDDNAGKIVAATNEAFQHQLITQT